MKQNAKICAIGEQKQNVTRRSVEHCTPHADGAWLNETWLVTVVIKYNSCIFMVKLRNYFFRSKIQHKHQHEILSTFMKITRVNKFTNKTKFNKIQHKHHQCYVVYLHENRKSQE